MAHHYVLLDACVAAAHFAPKTTVSTKLVDRSRTILTGGSTAVDAHLLIPNFCIAEVFSVFEKYRWGRTWNKQVKRSLTPREFHFARESFGDAIHNGSQVLQVELDRYHILCIDLISPINNAYKIKRSRSKKAKYVAPAKTYDMLIVSMGIWLKHLFGSEGFTIVTGDERLKLVVERAKSVKLGKPMRDHLADIAENLGLEYGPNLYPCVLNLTNASKAELNDRFPGWNPTW